jgi:hypothetical protein
MATTISEAIPAVTMCHRGIIFLKAMADGADERHTVKDLVSDAYSFVDATSDDVREETKRIGGFLAQVALAIHEDISYNEGYAAGYLERTKELA